MQVSKYLRTTGQGYLHWCPGCNEVHYIQCTSDYGSNWQFNGQVDAPDFKPSVKITHNMTPEKCKEWEVVQCCHYFINQRMADNGQLIAMIDYCSDSTHSLAGKCIPLPVLPEHIRD